jgi:hypothetical protein
VDRRAFPALAAFLKGYLHEDFPDEHGSPAGAVRAFCRDASAGERRALESELVMLLEAARKNPPRALQRFVTRELGSGWNPKSADDLERLLAVVRGGG